jgi:hypothetical protein
MHDMRRLQLRDQLLVQRQDIQKVNDLQEGGGGVRERGRVGREAETEKRGGRRMGGRED